MSDELLVVLSRRGQVSWPTCRRYMDELYDRLGDGRPRPRHLEMVAAATLQALGHATVDFTDGSGVVWVAPRVLARLPVAGRLAAILVGHRTGNIKELLLDCCRCIPGARATAAVDEGAWPLTPDRLFVEADSEDGLAAVAAAVEARFDPDPAAWRVLRVAETVAVYRGSLQWGPMQHLNWKRRDFDTDKGRWVETVSVGDGLAEFTDPRTLQRTYRLRRGERMAEVDRAWGCYVALAAAGRDVLLYDGVDFYTPLSARPPAPFDTALALCSGVAPRVATVAAAAALPTAYLRYAAVPRPLATLAAAKLSQRLVPVSPSEPAP